MKFGVVVFPGSNCDDDMVHVLSEVMGQKVEKLWHKETELKGYTKNDCIIGMILVPPFAPTLSM